MKTYKIEAKIQDIFVQVAEIMATSKAAAIRRYKDKAACAGNSLPSWTSYRASETMATTSEPSAVIRAARDAYESARDAHSEAMPEASLAYEFYRCFAGDADDAPEYDPELPEVMPEEFRREYERMCVES